MRNHMIYVTETTTTLRNMAVKYMPTPCLLHDLTFDVYRSLATCLFCKIIKGTLPQRLNQRLMNKSEIRRHSELQTPRDRSFVRHRKIRADKFAITNVKYKIRIP